MRRLAVRDEPGSSSVGPRRTPNTRPNSTAAQLLDLAGFHSQTGPGLDGGLHGVHRQLAERKNRLLQPRALDGDAVEVGEVEIGVVEQGAVEDGILQVGTPHAGPGKVGVAEAAGRQVGFCKLCEGQVHPIEVQSAEVQTANVGVLERGPSTDGVLYLLSAESAWGALVFIYVGCCAASSSAHHRFCLCFMDAAVDSRIWSARRAMEPLGCDPRVSDQWTPPD